MIGFPINNEEDDWSLEIEMWFGDTLSQARELYNNKIDEDRISSLEKNGWHYSPHFHVSFMQTHLVWLDTPEKKKKDYIQYWIRKVSDIKQYSKEELRAIFDKLCKDEIVEINTGKENKIKTEIVDTNRKKFYVSPGFGLSFSLNSKMVKELDSTNKLAEEIKHKIIEGLSILNKEVTFLKQ